MDNNSWIQWLALLLFAALYVYHVQHTARHHKGLRSYTVPTVFGLFSLYYLLKPYLLPTALPTMRNGIMMTFYGLLALIGFAVLGICRRARGLGKSD